MPLTPLRLLDQSEMARAGTWIPHFHASQLPRPTSVLVFGGYNEFPRLVVKSLLQQFDTILYIADVALTKGYLVPLDPPTEYLYLDNHNDDLLNPHRDNTFHVAVTPWSTVEERLRTIQLQQGGHCAIVFDNVLESKEDDVAAERRNSAVVRNLFRHYKTLGVSIVMLTPGPYTPYYACSDTHVGLGCVGRLDRFAGYLAPFTGDGGIKKELLHDVARSVGAECIVLRRGESQIYWYQRRPLPIYRIFQPQHIYLEGRDDVYLRSIGTWTWLLCIQRWCMEYPHLALPPELVYHILYFYHPCFL
jgi:hypothetical protein